MPFDAFVKFVANTDSGCPDIQGEVLDPDFKGGFAIKSFTWGASNACTIGTATGGAGGGKCQFEKFQVTKDTDKATPLFFLTCACGGHFKTATLTLRKAGGTKGKSGSIYLVYTFYLVFVTKITWKGSGGGNEDAPEEDLEFAYGAVQIQYNPQSASGATSSQGPVITQWSQVTNDMTTNVGQ
jgi:type VI secretion system secreted protein Hcp